MDFRQLFQNVNGKFRRIDHYTDIDHYELGGRIFYEIKVALEISDKGRRESVALAEIKEPSLDHLQELLEKTIIRQLKNCLEMFGLENYEVEKVQGKDGEPRVKIADQGKDEGVLYENVGKEDLSEEQLENWNDPQVLCAFADDIKRMRQVKDELGIGSNKELIPYVKDFSKGEKETISDIKPRDMEAFLAYLTNLLEQDQAS